MKRFFKQIRQELQQDSLFDRPEVTFLYAALIMMGFTITKYYFGPIN
jgi:hypothetical protein